MDNDVSAGNGSTVVAGRLALGVTLLAFGLGTTGVIDGVTASDAVSVAHYVGGVALFLVGLLALRDRDTASGTGYAALGALWFTWAVSAGSHTSADAAGLFMLLFALVALSLTLGGGDTLGQAVYGLLFLAMLVLAVAAFADSSALAKAGGWVAVVSGALAWYAATALLAHWPTALPRRAAGRGVTATG
ncbi:GPR1/FUN34/YaaH family transporter [Streptomyces sp. NPDC051636]|uniref:GPR1/FUN34/YaaH family transporter n=1 Tax=Streptomyces sp. NPDC051636 TaxID=3365663 RepID=UPI0037A013D2